ncbi:hypothetical protein FCULG_00006523 [Fusarium culmorum]|uniref:Uncharacterized protein n=1 Tax=Fusarium culmorum TaxID=5516 RepID=A0A2T4GTM4_FUSCU|nr:hypothetical protein FCULG_00006523 [Fusarium culmorum]
MPSPLDIATYAFIVTLKALCSVDRIYAHAIKRGFNLYSLPMVLKNEYLKDAPYSGYLLKAIEEAKKLAINRFRREKTCADIAGDLSAVGLKVSILMKGLYYCWSLETKKEKTDSIVIIDTLNK